MITVYTITYNEEVLLPFMINHYRQRFPSCRVVVHDNMSTDNTTKIAQANNCEVISFGTNNKFKISRPMKIKNHCWKNASTDWVLVCDLDELLDINAKELKMEEGVGTSIIKTKGYNMVTLNDNLDIAGMKHGERDEGEDKSCLFNKKFIDEINYSPGAHTCHPIGTIVHSKKTYKLFHYCYINYNLSVKKYKIYQKRLSQESIENRRDHYTFTPKEVRALYTQARNKAIKVR